MAALPKWHRKAPAAKPKPQPAPRAWNRKPDPWAQNDDGTEIPRAFRCIERPDAGLRRMLSMWA